MSDWSLFDVSFSYLLGVCFESTRLTIESIHSGALFAETGVDGVDVVVLFGVVGFCVCCCRCII